MELKKSKKVDLERRRKLYFQLGLFIALIFCYAFINYKDYKTYKDLGNINVDLEDELIPITEREKTPPPPPPPPPKQTVIKIIDNSVDIEDDIDINVETTEEEEIDFTETVAEEEEAIAFAIVEDKPIFPGCEDIENKIKRGKCFERGVLKHIKNNFEYPEIAKEMGAEGTVHISFTVSKTGKVKNVRVIRSVDKSLENEGIRLVKSLPKMTPGKQRNKPVKVTFIVPIKFRLN